MFSKKVVIAIICSLLAVIAICIQTVRLYRSHAENERLASEIESLKVDVANEREENARLRDLVERSHRALEETVRLLEESAHDNTQRIETIDNADPNWLLCPLPDDVRNAFSDYCYAGDQAADGSLGAVQETDG